MASQRNVEKKNGQSFLVCKMSRNYKVCKLTSLDKGSGEQPRFAAPLQGPFVPSIVAFLVNVNNVAHSKLQFILAVRRVGSDAAESERTRIK